MIVVLSFILYVAVFVGVYLLVRRFVPGGSRPQKIIEAEKNRQAHPDIQSGKFTRLYTMPYYDKGFGNDIREMIRYFQEKTIPRQLQFHRLRKVHSLPLHVTDGIKYEVIVPKG